MTRPELVHMIVGHELDEPVPKTDNASIDGPGRPVLQLHTPTRDEALESVLSVRGGEIVGVAGLLGSGRSRMLRSMFGLDPTRRAETRVDGQVVGHGIKRAHEAGIAYLPEDRDGEAIFGDLSVRQNLTANAVGRYWRRLRFDRRQRPKRHPGGGSLRHQVRVRSPTRLDPVGR